MCAGGGHAYKAVTDHDFLMLADDAFSGDFQADSLTCGCSCSDDRFFADKLLFISLYKVSEACCHRGDFLAQLMAVERHGSFQAKGIARAQAAGDQAFFLAVLQEQIPKRGCVGCCHVEFKAVLTGVACAGDDAGDVSDFSVKYCGVIAFGDVLFFCQFTQDFFCLRALKGDLAVFR